MLKKTVIPLIGIFFFVSFSLFAGEKDISKNSTQNYSSEKANAIAIIDFQNKTDFGGKDFAEKALDAFESSLSSTNRFVLVERKKLDLVLKEQSLVRSGLFDTKTLRAIGKLASASLICTGSLEDISYSLNKQDKIKSKVLSMFGIKARTDPFGIADPDDYRSSWDLEITVNIKIIDLEKGVIVFNRSEISRVSRIRLRHTTTAPIYEPEAANKILRPIMDNVAKQIAEKFSQ